jgi:RNA polymerase sigma-70 factor (ECF subfamily)
MPDDPHDPLDGPLDPPLDPPFDEDEGVLGPVPDVTEGWDEGEEGEPNGESTDEEGETSPQPDDPNGVSRDMASVALTTPGLGNREAEAGETRTALGLKPVAGLGDWRSMTDAEIMLRVREGDDVGFNFLIEKYRKPIMNFMYRMVHNQAVAEELAQEVFLRVYRSRQTYRAEAKFTTWLYRIATNLGVNHARDTRHERAAQTIYLDQPDPETGTTPDVADARPVVEEELLKDERM